MIAMAIFSNNNSRPAPSFRLDLAMSQATVGDWLRSSAADQGKPVIGRRAATDFSASASLQKDLISTESPRLFRNAAWANRPILWYLQSNCAPAMQYRVARKLSNHVFDGIAKPVASVLLYNLNVKNMGFRVESATRPGSSDIHRGVLDLPPQAFGLTKVVEACWTDGS
jgi:hypothetical protein